MAGHELPKSMETRIEAIQESDGLGRLMKARDDLLDWMDEMEGSGTAGNEQ